MNSAILQKSEKIKVKTLDWLLVLLFIFISDDTLLFGTNSDNLFVNIKYVYIISITLVLILLDFIKQKKYFSKTVATLCFFTGFILLSMFFNFDVRIGYFYKIVLFCYSLFLLRKVGIRNLAYVFCKIMYFLSIVSIVGFLIVSVAQSLFEFAPKIINSANTEFYTLFIFNSPTSFYSDFVRNYGIFREPGVYQIYLMIALLFEFFYLDEKRMLPYLVFLATIVTTMSTTGYLSAGVFFLLLIWSRKGFSSRQKIYLISLILIGVIILILTTDIFSLSVENQYNSVFAKLFNTKRSTTVSRFASIYENIKIWLTSPVTGVGLEKLEEMFPEYTLKDYGLRSTHNTNTVFIQFAAHGFLAGVLWINLMYLSAKRMGGKNVWWVLAIFCLIFFGENLSFSGLAYLLLQQGLVMEEECAGECYG